LKEAAVNARVILPLVAVLVVACAQTTIRNSWKATEDTGPALRKVLVVGVTKRADVRRPFADGFVAALKAKGIDALPSYESDPDLAPEGAERLKVLVGRTGVDGVLVTRLVRRETKAQYVPGAPPPAYIGMNMYGYYPRVWTGYYDPPMVVESEIVTAEVNLFRAANEKLVWAATTETFAPSDIVASTKDFAKVVIAALSKDKLL
jgi:hypothetical protein